MYTQLTERLRHIKTNTLSDKEQTLFVFIFTLAFLFFLFYFQWNWHFAAIKITTEITVLFILFILMMVLPTRVVIIKGWLIAGTIVSYSLVFLFMVVVYYLILSPLFYLFNTFRTKRKSIHSSWKMDFYTNDDYRKMG